MTSDMRQKTILSESPAQAFPYDPETAPSRPLTKSGQRRIENLDDFTKAFSRELARAQRGHSIGGVLALIDFDNYEDIQTRYGTAAGEACIKMISGILAGEVRAMDVAARMDSSEFVLLLADTSAQRAVRRMQSLGLRLNNLSLIWQLREIQISVGISMKAYGADDAPDILPDLSGKEQMIRNRHEHGFL